MAQVKAGEVDRYLSKADGSIRIFLIYGPDRGLVSERINTLAKLTKVDTHDPFSFIKLDMEDIANDPARLADEVNSIGMFGGERLIRITGNTRKDVSKIFKSLLENPPLDAWVIVEGEDLKKGTGLRKLFEASKNAMAIPCYSDNDAALLQLINQILGDYDLTINRNTANMLKSLLGGDRIASRGEIEKLALYAYGQSEVTEEHIHDIVGDASSLAIDELIDNVTTGNLSTLDHSLKRLVDTGMQEDMILIFALRHFQMLHATKSEMEKTNRQASAFIQSMRPPVHFSRKDKLIRALSIWPTKLLIENTKRLDKAALACRQNQSLSSSICGTTLLSIGLTAKRLSRTTRSY